MLTHAEPERNHTLTTCLEQGPTLPGITRQMVVAAAIDGPTVESVGAARNVRAKATDARLQEVRMRPFGLRFVRGSPPIAWPPAAVPEDRPADSPHGGKRRCRLGQLL